MPWLQRTLAFLQRHVWSSSLSLISALCFAQLASEIYDDDLTSFDSAVSAAVARWRGSADGMMLSLTRLGNPTPVLAFSVVVVATLWVSSRRREALYLALCASGTLLLNVGMKAIFQRERPLVETIYLLHLPTSSSFPSGHAMCSAGVLGSLAVVSQKLGLRPAWSRLLSACCLLLLLGVGASRVYFGVHFASDVIGGQLASIACVSALTGWFYPRLLPGEATTEAAQMTEAQ
jgi:undecaprenyl-diphosphatase